jgi:hypothetical protein
VKLRPKLLEIRIPLLSDPTATYCPLLDEVAHSHVPLVEAFDLCQWYPKLSEK